MAAQGAQCGGVQRRHVPAEDFDAAGREPGPGRQDAGHGAQQGGLAAAGGAGESGDTAGADLQAAAVQEQTAVRGGDREVRELAENLARSQDNTVFTEQHNNPSNGVGYFPVAHELNEALDGRLHVLIGAVGTGGALCGTARELRTLIPSFRTIGVEPKGSIAFGGPAHDYYQSGTGTPEGAEIGALVDFDLIDEGVKVGDVEAFATCRAVARTGLLIGGSAGGVVHVALSRLASLPPGTTMVALINDGGEKYLDTVFNDEWMRARGLLAPTTEREIEELLTKLRRNR